MIRYINIKTTAYGIETVDQFDTKDYKTRKEFFKDLHTSLRHHAQYAEAWISRRCDKTWKV